MASESNNFAVDWVSSDSGRIRQREYELAPENNEDQSWCPGLSLVRSYPGYPLTSPRLLCQVLGLCLTLPSLGSYLIGELSLVINVFGGQVIAVPTPARLLISVGCVQV